MRTATAEDVDTELETLRRQISQLTGQIAQRDARIAELAAEVDSAFRCSSIPKWIYDRQSLRVLDVNDAALALYGFQRHEFVGLSIADLYAPEERAMVARRLAGLDQADAISGCWRHARRDGTHIVVTVNSRDLHYGAAGRRLVILTDLTDRVRALAQLKESKEWLQRAVEYAEVGVWDLDLAKGWTRWSANVASILGFEAAREGISAREYERMVHPEDRESFVLQRDERLRSGSSAPVEYRLVGADGAVRWIFERSSHVRDENGEPVRCMGILQDITERKSTELALRDSEERFRTLTKLSSDWYWEQDADFRYTMIIVNCAGVNSDSPSRAIGKRRWELGWECLSEGGWERHRDALEARRTFRGLELRYTWPNGQVSIFSTSGVPMFDRSGRFLGYRGVGRDISAAKAAEEALRQSEACFRLLAEGSRSVVWISDPAMTAFRYLSPSLNKVDGMSVEALMRAPSLWWNMVHPDDAQGARDALAKQCRGEPVDIEVRFVQRSGDVRWLAVRSHATTDNQGESIVCGVAEDITFRKREHLRKVEEAVRQRDTLVREVHHRIKNNLQGVAGLLRTHAQRAPGTQTVLETAIAQVQTIATVHGLQGARVRRADFIDTVTAITRMLEGLSKLQVPLSVERLDAAAWALADAESVSSALIINELILNAIKHTVCPLSVRVRVGHLEDGAYVAVNNPGRLPKGFDLSARRGLGTGLGLVCALLPGEGLNLDISQTPDGVESRLTLRQPIIQPTTTNELEIIA